MAEAAEGPGEHHGGPGHKVDGKEVHKVFYMKRWRKRGKYKCISSPGLMRGVEEKEEMDEDDLCQYHRLPWDEKKA